ncbi:site-specific DNA-methyltransferase, partial [Candidatus Parcubacteria bacterium]|nr:site-specific DNA-methyltransferase [Candidatus Parcubacteria bacterium]
MKNIFEQLTDLLKKDERLVSQDGVLLKNQTQELARKNDPELIKLLLSDKAIKQHFFFEVEKTLIFDKEKFVRFISNKQFLPDSYTAFKNKIGLTAGDEYVSENKEVVLAWPYKDCVLEGGMTKEDQKRDEIFYNETLAPDDINRLLDAKVFTNFKRIDKKGEHKLDGFKRNEKGTIKDNLIIKGNNLLALASLKKEFAGKVKLIYIDPPYNTGNDGFQYNDSFSHSSWLVFMKNRLEVAKELLQNDGVI